jgi:hypothetical protein
MSNSSRLVASEVSGALAIEYGLRSVRTHHECLTGEEPERVPVEIEREQPRARCRDDKVGEGDSEETHCSEVYSRDSRGSSNGPVSGR